jgi:hypothetical protein
MPRLLIALLLVGCHPAEPPAKVVLHDEPCPGHYALTPGTCTAPAPTECHGVCGVVLRTRGCVPLPHAAVTILTLNLTTAVDADGHFDIGPLEAGHYELRVSDEQDVGAYQLDATGEPQILPAPLELQLAERTCRCGGDCPN